MRSLLSLSFFLVACGSSATTPAPAAEDSGTDAEVSVPSGPLTLENGEVAEVPGDGTFRVRLATPTGTEGFVIVLGSTRFDRTSGTFPYSIALDPIEGDTAATIANGCSIDAAAWSTPPKTETPPSGTAPAVGTKRTLQIGGTAIDAEVMAVGTTAVVWRDVSATSMANLDAAFVTAFLDDFEKVIVPRERAIFGVESDQDGDGHIGLVFSPLTYSDMAIAYFSGCDLQALTGCPEGNKGEFIYLTPPDVIAPPYNTPAAMKEILAHETAHLVEFNRKVLRNGITGNPDSAYMAEGIGALAQDVIGFQAGNLYVTQAGLQQLDAFSLANVLKDHAAYDSKLDGTMRGGAYLFARFLYDRAGGDTVGTDGSVATKGGPAFFRALLDDKTSVTAALGTVGKVSVPDVAMDFFTALAMSNREHVKGVAPKNACFAYLPQVNDPVTTKPRGVDLFGMFHGMPMGGPKLQKASAPSGTIKPGGVELLTVDATGTGELDVTVTVDAGATPRVRIGRIR
ncbi:MAG: hypothetical protein ACXVEF_23455 [Polyangiales bacterium]